MEDYELVVNVREGRLAFPSSVMDGPVFAARQEA
jgi:hypothetical protein